MLEFQYFKFTPTPRFNTVLYFCWERVRIIKRKVLIISERQYPIITWVTFLFCLIKDGEYTHGCTYIFGVCNLNISGLKYMSMNKM